MHKEKYLRLVFVLFVIVLGPTVSQAQPLPPPNPVPVDGGLSLLAGAGAHYAFRKLKQKRGD